MKEPINLTQIKTLTALLNWRTENQPNQIIFHFHKNLNEYESITYSQLKERAQQLAGIILSYTEPGDKVLIVLPPGLDYIVAFFATLYAGTIAVPIYPPANDIFTNKMQYIIDECQPKLLVINQSSLSKFRSIRWLHKIPGISFFLKKISNHYPQLMLKMGQIKLITTKLSQTKLMVKLPDIAPEMLAFLQYSSGSTGDPKGVMLTHENLIENLKLIYDNLHFQEKDIGVFWLPPYHDFGLIGAILETIYAELFTILMSPQDFIKNPKLWFQLITRYKGTITGGPNFCFDYAVHALKNTNLTDIDLSSVKFMFNAAEPVKARTLETFTQKFAPYGFKYEMFFPAYGLAEATLYVTGHHAEHGKTDITVDKITYAQGKIVILPEDKNNPNAIKLISSGKAKNGVAIYNTTTQSLCIEGEIGEIVVNNACVAQGYWAKPELADEIFFSLKIAGKNYLKTGDLGFIYQNMLFISVRIKDVITIQEKS
ncbi:MAG: AMP-binding protein, partial [Gammaproteobacteria bacterium]